MPFQKLGPSDVLSKAHREAAAEVVIPPQSPAAALRRGLVPPHTNGVLRSPSTPPVLNALVRVWVEAVCSGDTNAGSVQALCSRSHEEPRRGGNWTPAALVPGYHCCHCTAEIFATICTAFLETGKSLLAPLCLPEADFVFCLLSFLMESKQRSSALSPFWTVHWYPGRPQCGSGKRLCVLVCASERGPRAVCCR